MTKEKEIFLREDLRTGGFYELCTQVCPSIDNKPIKLYTDYIWTLDNVLGPFDNDYNKVRIDIDNFEHKGLLKLDDFLVPFKTFNIREDEPIEKGFNWFDISFYTSAIETVFGSEYKTWTKNPKVPPLLDRFLNSVISDLIKIHRFQLAIIDFEVSGEYYLNDLKEPLNNYTNSRLFVCKENNELIADTNRKRVTIID